MSDRLRFYILAGLLLASLALLWLADTLASNVVVR
jgi:hypothetical protein